MKEKVRINPRIRGDVARLSKAKAAQIGITHQAVVEYLLIKWVNGDVELNYNEKLKNQSKQIGF